MTNSKDDTGATAVSGSRKIAAWLIRATGFLLGAAVAVALGYLMWSPPPADWQHMRLRSFVGYALTPVFVFAGIFWLADRAAAAIDKRRQL